MVNEVIIPILDQTGGEVTITEWLKKEGDPVEAGEVICEVEASKANVEIEAQANGILRRILIEVGAEIPPLTVIALIAQANEPLPDVDPYYRVNQADPQEPAPEPMARPTSQPASSPPRPSPKNRIIASPRAKRLAREHNINLSDIQGTGSDGRIVEEDVLEAIEQQSAG